MEITLPLSTEEWKALQKHAAAAGTSPAGYVLAIVQEQLEPESSRSGPEAVAYSEWNRDFRAWIDGHRSRNATFDDSRESLYD